MKNITLFMFAILFAQLTFSQTMIVHKKDASTVNVQLSEVDSITFWMQTEIPLDSLMAYYPFNGNANDESGLGAHGTVNGAMLVSDRFGSSNSAYSFNGTNSYIVISDTSRLQLGTGDFTVTVWIKSTSSGRILSRGECGGSLGWQMSLLTSGQVAVAMQSPAFSGPQYFTSIDSTYGNDQWHFITFTRSSANVQLYTEGNSNGAGGTFVNTITNNNIPLGIGRNMEVACTGYYTGYIDDICIYNRALSPTEIHLMYHKGGW